MADDVDDVLDQYKVEGLDPEMLEGVIEPPLSATCPEPQEQVVVQGVEGDKKQGSEKKPEPPKPVLSVSLPQIAAQVGASMPDSSEIRKALANPAANDKLTETIRKDDSTLTILNTVMEEIAEEAAYIKAWRNQVWDGKEDISEATLSRIKMLSELVKAIAEREKLKKSQAVGKIDFHSENFQNVLKYFMSVIVETFRRVKIPPAYEDIFVTQLAKDFDGFEKKAEKLYYGKK